MSAILQTASGFTFEYENLIGEGKVTAGEIEAIRGKIDQAHAATMRQHLFDIGNCRAKLHHPAPSTNAALLPPNANDWLNA